LNSTNQGSQVFGASMPGSAPTQNLGGSTQNLGGSTATGTASGSTASNGQYNTYPYVNSYKSNVSNYSYTASNILPPYSYTYEQL
jgi:hypothetical protein